MGDFTPTKAITVRVPVRIAQMLEEITQNTGQTNKETIESLIKRAYEEMEESK